MDKTNEAGMVTITTKEYRDLITDMAEHRKEAEHERLLRWKADTELKELKEELALTRKRVAELSCELERYEEVENND